MFGYVQARKKALIPLESNSFKRARAASRDEQAVWMRFIRMCKRNKTLRYIFIIILFLFIVFFVMTILWKEDLSKIGDAFNILNKLLRQQCSEKLSQLHLQEGVMLT